MSSVYEWTDRALALPGAPDIWLQAAEGNELIYEYTDEGLYGIASDGTWWEHAGRSDRPWVLAVKHPATEGVLLRLLGKDIYHLQLAGMAPDGTALWHYFCSEADEAGEQWSAERLPIGRAAIAAAAAHGRWPGPLRSVESRHRLGAGEG
jgi:hypothetical protein